MGTLVFDITSSYIHNLHKNIAIANEISNKLNMAIVDNIMEYFDESNSHYIMNGFIKAIGAISDICVSEHTLFAIDTNEFKCNNITNTNGSAKITDKDVKTNNKNKTKCELKISNLLDNYILQDLSDICLQYLVSFLTYNYENKACDPNSRIITCSYGNREEYIIDKDELLNMMTEFNTLTMKTDIFLNDLYQSLSKYDNFKEFLLVKFNGIVIFLDEYDSDGYFVVTKMYEFVK